MSQNLVSKEEHETLTEFQAKVDQAKMEAEPGDIIWVETSSKICKYYNRQGMGKAEYFDYQGVKVCENGRSEEIRARLDRQLGDLVHGDAKTNQISQTKPNVNSVR